MMHYVGEGEFRPVEDEPASPVLCAVDSIRTDHGLRGDRRDGISTLLMPDGTAVSLAHDAPFELAASMTLAVYEAWKELGLASL
jgi:hypothetical protein